MHALEILKHIFCFSAMGPVLPQINVFGKELGIEPDVMGYMTAALPIFYVLAKPVVGFLMDYFTVNEKRYTFNVHGHV